MFDSKSALIVAFLVVAIIVLVYYMDLNPFKEGYNPGYYTTRDGKRMIPVLLDDEGSDTDFWFRDRHRDRIRGFYQGSNLQRHSCDIVQNYEKMLPWGSKIYVDGGY